MSWATTHLNALIDALAQVEPAWVVAALLLQLGNLVLRSAAWRNVLAAAFDDDRPGLLAVGRAYAIGVGLNGWLPARGGDAAKIAIVRAEHPQTNAVALTSSLSVLVAFDSLVALALLMTAGVTGAIPLPALDRLAASMGSSMPIVLAVVVLILVVVLIGSRVYRDRLRSGWKQARQGVRVVASPGRWARTVLSLQLTAWSCRIGVVFCLLCAFGIPATPQLAALVVVVGGMSTLVPIPGGAGSQQALAVFALASVAPASQAIAFSLGMQLGVTALNTTIAIVAAMVAFGHLHPVRAIRAAIAAGTPVVVEPVPDPVS
ncbi:MAG: flippase-like protein [Thermoleophilia bacterium]|nr:flippase-like protein [Thermoleophilia bacterium]